MGHDLYIQARIREKRTERVISCGDSDDYAAQEDIGFFDICWWCGSPECDVRIKMRQPWRDRLYRFRSVYPHSAISAACRLCACGKLLLFSGGQILSESDV